MDPYHPVNWDGEAIEPDPKDIYTIHDWSAVDEAVRLYHPDKVELAVHPNASLRFANEFVKEFKTGPGVKDGYPVLNPEIAYCKSQVFECLQPHVKAVRDFEQSLRTEIIKLEAVVGEMIWKHASAKKSIFPNPPPGAKVLEPHPQNEQVFLQVSSKRGLNLIAAAAKKHLPVLPEKCTNAAEMALAQPSQDDVQAELYLMNLQFLQGKLKLLGSLEDQVKKLHLDMEELLLGNTPVGSARTVMDFMDVSILMDKGIHTADHSPISKKSSMSKSNSTSPSTRSPAVKNKAAADDDKSRSTKSPKTKMSGESSVLMGNQAAEHSPMKISSIPGNSTSPKTRSPAMKNKDRDDDVKTSSTKSPKTRSPAMKNKDRDDDVKTSSTKSPKTKKARIE